MRQKYEDPEQTNMMARNDDIAMLRLNEVIFEWDKPTGTPRYQISMLLDTVDTLKMALRDLIDEVEAKNNGDLSGNIKVSPYKDLL